MSKSAQKIKKTLFITAIILLAVVFAMMFLACEGREITSLTVKNPTVTIKVGDSLNLEECIEKEGNGKLLYSIENTNVLSLDGSVVKGITVGKATVMIIGGDFTVKISVTVSNDHIIKISFPDRVEEYTGEEYFINPIGHLPDGSKITYYHGESEFLGAKDAGVYNLKAEVTLPEGYVLDCPDDTPTLTINKALYTPVFGGDKYVYDGTEKVITVKGDLPEGITVKYKSNKATTVGEYVATAEFSGQNANYQLAESIVTGKFVIEKQSVSVAELGLCDVAKVYDGAKVTAKLKGLPNGAEVKYYVYDKTTSTYVEKQSLEYKDYGEYFWYAKIFASQEVTDNYAFYKDDKIITFTKDTQDSDVYISDNYLTAKVTINKKSIPKNQIVLVNENDKIIDKVVYKQSISIFDKENKSDVNVRLDSEIYTGIGGELEDKITINYVIDDGTNQTLPKNDYGYVNCGIYNITVSYVATTDAIKNYILPTDVTFALNVTRAEYDGEITFSSENVSPEYDGNEKVFIASYDENVLSVTYSYRRNGGKISSVKHAGEYEIKASFTLINDANNYFPVPSKTISFTVTPKKVEISGIAFTDEEKTYDGTYYSLTAKGLPDKVSVTYKGSQDESFSETSPQYLNAGDYQVVAKFLYDKDNEIEGDSYFVIDGITTNELTATLTINKGTFDKEITDEIATKYATVEGGTYFYGMKYIDIEFLDNSDGYLSWQYATNDTLIGEMQDVDTSKQGKIYTKARYNSDTRNYHDFTFDCTIILAQCEIDVTYATIPTQFIKQGESVYFENVNADFSEITVSTVKQNENGTYTVTVKAEKPNNYYFVGETMFTNQTLYYYDGNEFTYRKGTTSLTKYNGTGKEVVVLTGTTEISPRIFDVVTASSTITPITKVTIPSTVTVLPKLVFYGATSLQQITLDTLDYTTEYFKDHFGSSAPTSVKVVVKDDTEIADNKFKGMSYLKEIVYENKVTKIGDESFVSCSGLTVFDVDLDELVSVGDYIFDGCYALSSLTIPYFMNAEGATVNASYYFNKSLSSYAIQSITFTAKDSYALADYTFAEMSSLKKITLSQGLTDLGAFSFKNITAEINFDTDQMLVLSDYAYAGYLGTSACVPDSVITIEKYAFRGANNLTSVVIPQNVTTLNAYAFCECVAEISFAGDDITTIGKDAFNGYLGKNVTLPSSVTVIGERAFYQSTIESVKFLGDVTVIGKESFAKCLYLTKIIIPSSVEEIGASAFLSCGNLSTFIFEGKTPPTTLGTNAFYTSGAILITLTSTANYTEYSTRIKACMPDGYDIKFTVK